MRRTIEEYERIARIFDALITDLYGGKGLQAIVDRGAELLGNPIVILDTSFSVLAVTSDFKAADEAMRRSQITGYLDENTVSMLKTSHYLHKLGSSNTPLVNDSSSNAFHAVSSGYGWIDGAVRFHGIVVGYLCVYGANRPFSEEDTATAAKLMQLVSMEFQKNAVFLQNHGIQFETILVDLLEGRITEPQIVTNRLRTLGRQMLPPYYVVVTRHSALQRTQTGFSPGLQARLRQFFPNGVSAVYNGNIVLLTSEKSRPAEALSQDEDLLLFLEQNELHLGVSERFVNPVEAPDFYQQAVFCMNLPRDHAVQYFSSCTVDYALASFGENHRLEQLCHPALLRLAESERHSDRELVETLYLYLNRMKNAETVSARLHIHKNTLFYRINKIKQLLGIDLDNGDDILRILFSFKVLERLGLIKFQFI